MDIGSIFPSSDNLYKFLFMGGIFMVAFSFVYPLEKKQKIELEIILYNKQIELLNEQISQLNKDVDRLKVNTKEILKKLESIKNSNGNKTLASKEITEIQEEYNLEFHSIKSKETEVLTKNIILKYEKDKIGLLQKHISSFFIFRWLFLIIGSFFTLTGLGFWWRSTCVSTEIQKIELQKRKKEQ